MSTNTSHRNRTPMGTPDGGQFAADYRDEPAEPLHVNVPGHYLDEPAHDTGMNAEHIEPEQLRDAAAKSIAIPPEDGHRPGDPLKTFLPGDLEPATDEQIDATHRALGDDQCDSDLPRIHSRSSAHDCVGTP